MRKQSVNWKNHEVDKQNLNHHRQAKEPGEATHIQALEKRQIRTEHVRKMMPKRVQ